MTKLGFSKNPFSSKEKGRMRECAQNDSSTPRIATFSLLYESRDGRLCLFEDKQGHLTAVRSERFA